MTPEGSWTGATGTTDGTRAMRPAHQMAIGSITKTIVAARVMIPNYVDALWDSLSTDKRRVRDTEELLALVGSQTATSNEIAQRD